MEGLDVQERETEVDEFWMFVRRRVVCLEMASQLNFLSARRIAPPSSPFS